MNKTLLCTVDKYLTNEFNKKNYLRSYKQETPTSALKMYTNTCGRHLTISYKIQLPTSA